MCFCVMFMIGKTKKSEYTKFGLEIRRMRRGTRLNPESRDDLRKNSLRKLFLSFIRYILRAVERNTSNLEFRDIYSLVL